MFYYNLMHLGRTSYPIVNMQVKTPTEIQIIHYLLSTKYGDEVRKSELLPPLPY